MNEGPIQSQSLLLFPSFIEQTNPFFSSLSIQSIILVFLFKEREGEWVCWLALARWALNPLTKHSKPNSLQQTTLWEEKKESWTTKEKRELLSLFCLFARLLCCGALGGARPINPQQTRKAKQTKLLRSSKHNSSFLWLFQPQPRNEELFCLLPWLTAPPLSGLACRSLPPFHCHSFNCFIWFHFIPSNSTIKFISFHCGQLTHKLLFNFISSFHLSINYSFHS